jgi:hypothetical protein
MQSSSPNRIRKLARYHRRLAEIAERYNEMDAHMEAANSADAEIRILAELRAWDAFGQLTAQRLEKN